jgi:glycosyltransferase involved in cell wall biosynthesis
MRILAVHHDAGRNGACLLFLAVLTGLVRDHGAAVTSVFPVDGPMVEAARALGPAFVVPVRDTRRRLPRALRPRAFDVVFANSTASVPVVARVAPAGGPPLVVYAHESRFLLEHQVGVAGAAAVLGRASRILAAAPSVRDALVDLVAPSAEIVVVPGFVPPREPVVGGADPAAIVPPSGPVVGAVGTMAWYKGVDLFPVVARRVRDLLAETPGAPRDVEFVWVGSPHTGADRAHADHDTRRGGLGAYVRFAGSLDDPTDFLHSLSVLLLPSREDSWPLVMLEAAAVGVPTVCFEETGGAADFVADGAGTAVPYLDVEAMARAVVRYVTDPDARAGAGALARERAGSVTSATQTARVAAILTDVVRRG